MVGDEVIPIRSMLEISHPISEGIIKDIDDMETLWRYGITTKVRINSNL
jgi:actin-related protein 2